MESYLKRVEEIFSCAYSNGYADGYKEAKEQFGQHSRGTAHIELATPEQVKRWGKELFGWCDCGRAIEGRWVGLANFCPWCGRVMEWKRWEKPPEIVTLDCFMCGGKGTMKGTRARSNGHFHGKCEQCGCEVHE